MKSNLPIPRVEVSPQGENTWNINLYATEKVHMWQWCPNSTKEQVDDEARVWSEALGLSLVIDGKVVEHQPKLPGTRIGDRKR